MTKGYLIIISTNDGDPFSQVDESLFELKGDTLYYNQLQVENTYMVFNISFETLKGANENANWYKKYNEAINTLDKIQLTIDKGEMEKVFTDAKTLWIEGNALLDADATYINFEKVKIKGLAIRQIKDKYAELTQASAPIVLTTDILQGLTSGTTMTVVQAALPITVERMNRKLKVVLDDDWDPNSYENSRKKMTFNELIDPDSDAYLNELKQNNLTFKLGKN